MELKEKREGMAQMDGNEVMGTCNNQSCGESRKGIKY
jgi:hypothetical protein